MTHATDFYLKQLRPLVGGTITGLARSDPCEDAFEAEFYGLVVTLPNGQKRTLLLLSDDEGNGPGSFEICE
ncbi:MAG: hypothetical protein KJ049_01815 [Gammaproteobacteria bacterium]|nr:hypothetical protein [Gammaproteobacteria bacterium]